MELCAAQSTACLWPPTNTCCMCSFTVCARQDMKAHLERVRNLQVLLECPCAYLAVALAGSSLPKAALELAQQLERSGDAKAVRKVTQPAGFDVLLCRLNVPGVLLPNSFMCAPLMHTRPPTATCMHTCPVCLCRLQR